MSGKEIAIAVIVFVGIEIQVMFLAVIVDRLRRDR
jgi:hypothetical protein